MSQLDVLLAVMESEPEPISYKDVEQRTGLPQTSVARNLRLLGSRRVPSDDPNGPGYDQVGMGLVESTIDPWDSRRYAAKLTPKGKTLARSIIQLFAVKAQSGRGP
jgi:DNA-binding MarR family transcriptional regulator